MIGKLGTAIGYAFSPAKYRFVYRLVRTRLAGGDMSLDHTSQQATAWCRSLSQTTDVALAELKLDRLDPVTLHADIFSASEDRVSACPQEMGGRGNLSLIYSLIRGSKARTVIETGVAYGWSTLATLLAFKDMSGDSEARQLFSTNLHYPKYEGDEQFVGCAVPQELRSQWRLFSGPDEQKLPLILEQISACDLVHYDSSKSYAGRMFAYPLLWNALRVGGLFVSDDIDDNVGFKHFCTMVKCAPIIVETPQASGSTKYVGIIRKTSERRPRPLMF